MIPALTCGKPKGKVRKISQGVAAIGPSRQERLTMQQMNQTKRPDQLAYSVTVLLWLTVVGGRRVPSQATLSAANIGAALAGGARTLEECKLPTVPATGQPITQESGGM